MSFFVALLLFSATRLALLLALRTGFEGIGKRRSRARRCGGADLVEELGLGTDGRVLAGRLSIVLRRLLGRAFEGMGWSDGDVVREMECGEETGLL